MKTSEFITLLRENPNKALIFEYAPDKIIPANYHLTEVKNTTFDTVDCGGNVNYWQETIVQLWESPKEIGKTVFMTTDKIVAILDRVDNIKPMVQDAELKVEYGNDTFHTSVMTIHSFSASKESVSIKLHSEATLCKAPSNPEKEENSCGSSSSNCC